MAQVAVKEVDLSLMLNQLTSINQKFNVIDKVFSKLDSSFDKITQSTQKFNRSLQNSQKQSSKLLGTFSKIQDTLRFMAMTPFGKGLALGVGAISSAWDFAKNASAGTVSDLAAARGSGSTLKNLRAFDRASELGGVSDILNAQSMRQFKQNLNDVNMQGQVALLGSILGKNRAEMNATDTTDLYVKSLNALDKLVKSLGGYDNLASNVRGKQILEVLGLDISDLRSIDTRRLGADYNSQKMQGINEKIFAENERSMLKLGYGFKDLKDTLITALLPTFTEFAKKIQQITRSLTKWLLDNKVIEKIGKGLGNLANKLLNIKFEDIVEFFATKLPKLFASFGATLAGLVAKVTFGEEGDALYRASKEMKLKSMGVSDRELEQYKSEAAAEGYISDKLFGKYLENRILPQIKQGQQIELKITTADNLKAEVVKTTAGANLARKQ